MSESDLEAIFAIYYAGFFFVTLLINYCLPKDDKIGFGGAIFMTFLAPLFTLILLLVSFEIITEYIKEKFFNETI